jgi:hypothetical protein
MIRQYHAQMTRDEGKEDQELHPAIPAMIGGLPVQEREFIEQHAI